MTVACSAGCSSRTSAPATNGAFTIGIGATPGKPGYAEVVRGAGLAIDRLNEAAKGRVAFTLREPQPGTASVVQIAALLRNDSSVIGVVGHPESGTSLEAIPVYADAEHGGANAVVAVSPTATSPRLSGASPWFFRVAPSDNDATRFVARYVADTLGARTAAIVYRNDAYGRDWAARFAEAYVDRKGGVVLSMPYLADVTEWAAYALALAHDTPQVLLFAGDANDAASLLRALKDANVSLTFIGGDATEALTRTHEFPDAKYAGSYAGEASSRDGEAKHFAEAYRAKFNEAPGMFAALSYDATLAIGTTVLQGARTRKAVRDALEHMTATAGIDGAGGRIAFSSQHDIVGRTTTITTVGRGAN